MVKLTKREHLIMYLTMFLTTIVILLLCFGFVVLALKNTYTNSYSYVTISADWFEELVKVYFGNYSSSNNYIVQKAIEWDSQDTINLLVITSSETDNSLILNKNGTWRIEQ